MREGYIKHLISDCNGKQRSVYVLSLSGKTFNKLTAISCFKGKNRWKWICKCECGKETVVDANNLVSGHTQSCGCYGREQSTKSVTKHGLGQTPEYRTWFAMISRCHNPKRKGFKFYHKRNIEVCIGWKNSFESFYYDMGKRPNGLTLDRINNDMGYNCGHCEDCKNKKVDLNCRWASWEVQSRNKSNSRLIEYMGERKVIKDWAEKFGLHNRTLTARLNNGMSFEDAISVELHQGRRDFVS